MSFAQPDLLNFGPVPFWFWNDKLDAAELRRQVRLMRQGGVRNFIIHARWGLKTSYLSQAWWSQVKVAVDEAKAIGSRAWFYDEYNYPSGICGFKITREERYRERYVAVEKLELASGAKGVLKLPKGRLLGAYAYPVKQGRLDWAQGLDLSAQVRGGKLRFTAPKGHWRVYGFVMAIEPFKGSGKFSVNYLAPEPTQKFIQWTHEEYRKRFGKDFGKHVPAFFLDEPRFNNALPWDERFAAWFQKRWGYDLLPRLALLLDEGGPETAKTRRDYYALTSDLYSKNFFEPIGAYCKKHGIELTGHLMAEETLAGNTRFSGHGLKPYQHFSIPGADHLGKGIGGLAPKMASSMAAHYGRKRVSCEAFAGCGQGFQPREMNAITHWLFSQGIDLIIPHAFFYAMRTKRQRDDWPPSMFFQWKYWPQYPAYAARVARLSEALSGGARLADIALYYPAESFHAATQADPTFKTGYFKQGAKIANAHALRMEESFQRLGQALPQAQLDFHFVDRVTLGGLKKFKLLLLPFGAELDKGALAKVAAFKRRGGKVLSVGDLNSPAATQRALRKVRALLKTPDIRLQGPASLQGSVFEHDTRIHDPYLHQNLESVFKRKQGGVLTRHTRVGKEDRYLLASLVPQPLRFKARLRSQGSRVELQWPGTGRVERVVAKRLRGGVSEVSVSLPALEAVLVVIKP